MYKDVLSVNKDPLDITLPVFQGSRSSELPLHILVWQLEDNRFDPKELIEACLNLLLWSLGD